MLQRAIMLSPVRLSVRLSITRADQSRTVDIRIMRFSPQSSHMTLIPHGQLHREISRETWEAGALNKTGENGQFLANKSSYLGSGVR